MDDIIIVKYDPAWPAKFAGEAQKLREVFGDNLAAIEHAGSTAVPGLSAKPVIDILIGVPLLEAAKAAIPKIEALGYGYWREDTIPRRLYFVKGLPPNGPRSHHVHLVEKDSEFWRTHLLFRDILRADPEEARRYEELKLRLAARFTDDREAYTDGKADYIEAVLRKAATDATE